MSNPLLQSNPHEKRIKDLKNEAKLSPRRLNPKGYRNNPAITTTVSPEHAKFLNDLAVSLTIKYHKPFNNSEVLRLVIEYAHEFKDELPIFHEAKFRS